MDTWDTTLPPRLGSLHRLSFDYDDIDGMDFEPFDQFSTAAENASWFRAWTGNSSVDGAQFRIFGQDGTGGYAAFWIAQPGQPLEVQPIVFLGSEGAIGVVAANLDEYLWLLAAGVGPFEAVELPGLERNPIAHFARFAREQSKVEPLSAAEVNARANAAWPGFADYIFNLNR